MENDKTYLWLVIITTVALLTAFGLAIAEWNDYSQPLEQSESPFG